MDALCLEQCMKARAPRDSRDDPGRSVEFQRLSGHLLGHGGFQETRVHRSLQTAGTSDVRYYRPKFRAICACDLLLDRTNCTASCLNSV